LPSGGVQKTLLSNAEIFTLRLDMWTMALGDN
jgi:hypothetical protein